MARLTNSRLEHFENRIARLNKNVRRLDILSKIFEDDPPMREVLLEMKYDILLEKNQIISDMQKEKETL